MSIKGENFLQTDDWVDFQKSLGRSTFQYKKNNINANVIKHEVSLRKNYLYVPYGPELNLDNLPGDTDNSVKDFLIWLGVLAKEQNSIFIKVEPVSDRVASTLRNFGFRKVKKEIQPPTTTIIDLNNDEEVLLGKMHQKTRYNIRVGQKSGLEFRILSAEEFNNSWELFKKTAKRDKFRTHSEEYYEKLLKFDFKEIKTFLGGVFKEGKLIAVGIFLVYGDTGYYLHGASDYEYRKFMAPYLLHWKIIKYLRKINIPHYDLWGIHEKKWPGVTRFKSGWGGRIVNYPGSFDLTTSRLWYHVYKLFRGS
jgi:peptidoglycan pentaglycine glycine transferase (the first glycine)